MADESQVEAALVALVTSALYPDGTSQPSEVNAPVAVFRGWPTPKGLQRDIEAGVVSISVFSRNGVERNVTRYPREWQEISRAPKTITATVTHNVITIGGTVSTPQNVMAIMGRVGGSFSYAVQPGDTLNAIATGLATLIAVSYPGTTSTGPSVTVTGTPGIITARVGVSGIVGKELKRQDKSFQVTVWASTPALRDTVGAFIDPVLAEITFINFADGSSGFIRYERSITSDNAVEDGSYRRDLFFWVEFPTLKTMTAYEIGAVNVGTQGAQAYPEEMSVIDTNF